MIQLSCLLKAGQIAQPYYVKDKLGWRLVFHKVLKEAEKYSKLQADIKNQTKNPGKTDYKRTSKMK